MPPLVEELKSYKGNVVILKEREKMTEEYVYDYEDNVLKIYMKSLNKIDDFDKVMNIINECGIDHIDYIFLLMKESMKYTSNSLINII